MSDLFSYRETSRLVIPTNLEGVMGSGLARQLVEVDPGAADAYKLLCKEKDWWSWPYLPWSGNYIFFPTKRRPQEPSTYELVERSCQRLLGTLRRLKDPPHGLCIPPVGCGLGGLDKNKVMDILADYISDSRPWIMVDPECFAVLDVETTGFTHDYKVIEVAVALVSIDGSKPGRILERYRAGQDPGAPLPPVITKITGLTWERLRGKRINWGRVKGMLDRALFVVAHNAPFDRRFIAQHVDGEYEWLCSYSGIDWGKRGFQQAKLQGLLAAHGIDSGQKHRAMDDVEALIKLLKVGNYFSMLTYNSKALHNSSHGGLRQDHRAIDIGADRSDAHHARGEISPLRSGRAEHAPGVQQELGFQ